MLGNRRSPASGVDPALYRLITALEAAAASRRNGEDEKIAAAQQAATSAWRGKVSQFPQLASVPLEWLGQPALEPGTAPHGDEALAYLGQFAGAVAVLGPYQLLHHQIHRDTNHYAVARRCPAGHWQIQPLGTLQRHDLNTLADALREPQPHHRRGTCRDQVPWCLPGVAL